MLLGCIRGIILEKNSKIENSASVMITSRAAGRTSNSWTMLGYKINILILFHPVEGCLYYSFQIHAIIT